MLSIEACDEKILAITREHAKKARYPYAEEEKKKLQQARIELDGKLQVKDTADTSKRNMAEQNITR